MSIRWDLQSLLGTGLKVFPPSMRQRMIRRWMRVSPVPPPELTFKLAETKEELTGAFRLLEPDERKFGMQLTVHHALPCTSTVIALWNGTIAGTITLVRDNPLGLPASDHFDLSSMKTPSSRLAEVMGLALNPDFQAKADEILLPMFKYVYYYCRRFFGVDTLIVTTHAGAMEYFEALFFFKKLKYRSDSSAESRSDEIEGGALRFVEAYPLFALHYADQPAPKNLYQYFDTPPGKNFIFPERPYFKVADHAMTPDLLNYFFSMKTDVFSKLADRERQILRSLYDSSYSQVIPAPVELGGAFRPRANRFDVDCKGCALVPSQNPETPVLRIRDVSATGLRAFTPQRLTTGSRVKIKVEISKFDLAELEAQAIWTDTRGNYGFKILRSSSNWNQFIEYLSADPKTQRQILRSSG